MYSDITEKFYEKDNLDIRKEKAYILHHIL